MKKSFFSLSFFSLVLLLPNLIFAQVISISEARTRPAGTDVTVRGIVTNGSELGKIRYLQDGSAGIAAFPGNGSVAGFETDVTLGDEIEVTGKLVVFNGLLEISPITAFSVLSSQNDLPQPIPTSLGDLSEDLESQLVSIECVAFDNPGSSFSSQGTYAINDADGNPSVIFLRSASPLVGTVIPNAPVRLTAIVSQFNDYQLLPRTEDDLVQSPCFYITQQPEQTGIATDGFTVSWRTNLPSFSILKFGTTPQPTQEITSPGSGNAHSATLTGLQPGTIYWVQAVATHNAETALSEAVPFATKSLSSGQIKVFFNHSVDETLGGGGIAPSGQSFDEVLAETLARIEAAEKTIDVALYNNNRNDITNALKEAHQRGVRVRYVAAEGASSPALDPPPPFPAVYGNQFNLMHNKFMAIDAELTDRAWVMSGSMNWTTGNMAEDFNNTLFIQDQSLARTYELEFNEMWGSNGSAPDLSNIKFGSAKRDNTPHQFVIGDIPVQSYFSPTDGVTRRIENALLSADQDLQFALLSFTKNELGNAIVARHQAGVACRGIIDNVGDVGTEYTHLLDNGVSVTAHDDPEILHHKYAVVDATLPNSDPTVVTGSHNWSQAAETGNDENTLVIHDAAIAFLYLMEFEKRWSELSVSTETPVFQSFSVFPNPANTMLAISSGEKSHGETRLEIWDSTGKMHLSRTFAASEALFLPLSGLSDGLYFVKVFASHGFAALPFQKVSR